MTRHLAGITLDNLGDLPERCRSCVFWERGPVAADRSAGRGAAQDRAAAKESWVSSLLLDWGSCGKIAYVDSDPAGYVLFAPPAYVPRSVSFPTSPVAGDAALLMTVRVLPEFSGAGIGRLLVQGVVKDLLHRGIRAVEAFGDAAYVGGGCLVPADFLLAVGFKTVRAHPRYPRLRLELRNVLTWKEDVEVALERLLGMAGEPTLRPV
ncbi:MAG: GNAT family N-acetyltransferase [Actinomycetes bacterium]